MKHILWRFFLIIIALFSGVGGTFVIAFFPGKELLVFCVLFIIAAILAWRLNESIDAEIKERYEESYSNNPDVLDVPEEDKTEEPK